jgi:acyl dehydratase
MSQAVKEWYFEDFKPGDRYESGVITVTESMIVDFARDYDPQPLHMDPVAAAKSTFGGVIAPGVFTLALTIRLTVDLGLFHASNLGSPGIDALRWIKPVRPGDRLHAEVEVKEARASASKADRGVVGITVTTRNQAGEAVMSYNNVTIFSRRPG